jgi:hypothetical protein
MSPVRKVRIASGLIAKANTPLLLRMGNLVWRQIVNILTNYT